MFKNKVSFVLILVIIVIPAISLGAEIDSADIFDKTFLEKGIIGVNYESNTETKVMIEKGNNKYFYDLKFGDKFPLQFGNGEYVIAILEKVEGNKFKLIKSYKISVNIENQNDVYLGSIQKINWNEDMEAIKKSKEITKDLKTDKEKVAAVYNYIVNNIKYDYLKITRIDSSYIPSVEETFKTNKGICYDFSSLFAAMLRGISIPTKLVMGYKNDVNAYHAWNEVYLKDTNEWVTIDTSYDAVKKENGLNYTMIKDNTEYKAEKIY